MIHHSSFNTGDSIIVERNYRLNPPEALAYCSSIAEQKRSNFLGQRSAPRRTTNATEVEGALMNPPHHTFQSSRLLNTIFPNISTSFYTSSAWTSNLRLKSPSLSLQGFCATEVNEVASRQHTLMLWFLRFYFDKQIIFRAETFEVEDWWKFWDNW